MGEVSEEEEKQQEALDSKAKERKNIPVEMMVEAPCLSVCLCSWGVGWVVYLNQTVLTRLKYRFLANIGFPFNQ